MPKSNFYEGLSISEKLRKFAEYHGKKTTRHITIDEMTLIGYAADRLDELARLIRIVDGLRD